MKILATLSFGKGKHATSAWDYFETQTDAYMVVAPDQEGKKFVVKLDKNLVKDMKDHGPEKCYTGAVNASDGFLLKVEI